MTDDEIPVSGLPKIGAMTPEQRRAYQRELYRAKRQRLAQEPEALVAYRAVHAQRQRVFYAKRRAKKKGKL